MGEGRTGLRLVLGVTGGIAAYKSIELLRLLVSRDFDITPVLTADAHRFVGPVTFEALSGKRLVSSIWQGDDPIPHTTLGQGADAIVIAPATANFIARYAAGLADDLLGATLIASQAPVLIAPAMHTEMWEHPATRQNIATLEARGVVVLEPASGPLAGGDSGVGRMREPLEIAAVLDEILERSPRRLHAVRNDIPEGSRESSDLVGMAVLVTAGGTREPLDPVRFIGNRSSGRMGHAIAEAAHDRGAVVTLVTASSLASPPGVEVIRVETASEMEKETRSRFSSTNVVFMAAAVADFRPRIQQPSKIKKAEGAPVIELEPTVDILASLGAERENQFIVGFAAETDDLLANAAAKLIEKNVDLIVANDVSLGDAGFDVETNRVSLLWPGGETEELPIAEKRVVADALIDRIIRRREESA